jgi:hypothetical protein
MKAEFLGCKIGFWGEKETQGVGREIFEIHSLLGLAQSETCPSNDLVRSIGMCMAFEKCYILRRRRQMKRTNTQRNHFYLYIFQIKK